MLNIIVQISRYVLLVLMAFFTLNAFLINTAKTQDRRDNFIGRELSIIVLFDVLAFLVLFLQSRNFMMLVILGGLIAYIVILQFLYRVIYRKASLALVNNVCMLLSVGFVIQSRLGTDTALKQLLITAVSSAICLVIPVFIRKVKVMRNLSWVYAIAGIVLLGAVFVFGRLSGGANLSLTIGGISFQFSEFVKITFVFFIAAMLQEKRDLRQVIIVSVLAAIHVGILVLSTDLGAALIYFVAYLVMVYVATREPRYAAAGLGAMAAASVLAYHLFSHVRIRVQVWRDPFQDYAGTGYQIVQALFGVVAGGWFGTGLFAGNPEMIPLAKEDFTFAAICEELGILFGILLILLCMCMYLLIVNISMKLSNPFYKLVAMGLGTEYAFQVFLTVGGTTKFIPMTGITLPLVSYGGSSMMCTIIMFAIIEGLYMIREDEDLDRKMLREIIRRQNEKERRMERARAAGGNRRGGLTRQRTAGKVSRGTRILNRRAGGAGPAHDAGATRVIRQRPEEDPDATRVVRQRPEEDPDATRVIGGKAAKDAGATRIIRQRPEEDPDATRVIGGKASKDAGARRVVRQRPEENPDATRVIGGKAAKDAGATQVIAGRASEERKAAEHPSTENLAEKENLDIDELERKIEEETEKSLNY